MSKPLSLLLLALTLTLMSCHSADEFDSPSINPPLKEVTIRATNPFHSTDSLTRMTAKDLSFQWVDGDKADICMDNVVYTLTYSSNKEGFVGKVPNGVLTDNLVFLYPSGAYTKEGSLFTYEMTSVRNTSANYVDYFPMVGTYDPGEDYIMTHSLFNYINLGAFEEPSLVQVTPANDDNYEFVCGDYVVGHSSALSYAINFTGERYELLVPVFINANSYSIYNYNSATTSTYTTTTQAEDAIFKPSN